MQCHQHTHTTTESAADSTAAAPEPNAPRDRLRRGSTRYGDDSNRELERCALLMRHGCELLGVPETPLMHMHNQTYKPFRLSAFRPQPCRCDEPATHESLLTGLEHARRRRSSRAQRSWIANMAWWMNTYFRNTGPISAARAAWRAAAVRCRGLLNPFFFHHILRAPLM